AARDPGRRPVGAAVGPRHRGGPRVPRVGVRGAAPRRPGVHEPRRLPAPVPASRAHPLRPVGPAGGGGARDPAGEDRPHARVTMLRCPRACLPEGSALSDTVRRIVVACLALGAFGVAAAADGGRPVTIVPLAGYRGG